MSQRDVVIVASLVQKEVSREKDMPAVAEVIYNRLNGTCTSQGIPTGLLQLDSTVHYAAGVTGDVFTTNAMRNSNSPYNTYKHAGLPPGPISAPGEAALNAALHPDQRRLVLLRHGQPGDRTDQVRADPERAQRQRRRAAEVLPEVRPVLNRRRCAVLGSPIAHSLSPVMHRAGYAAAGLDWTFEPIDVSEESAARRSLPGSTTPGAASHSPCRSSVR